jgi:hypothetical protein
MDAARLSADSVHTATATATAARAAGTAGHVDA